MAITPGHRDLELAVFRALRKAILFSVAVFILFQFLGAVTFLVLFFGMVFLIAAALNPVVAWLQRHRIPRPVSAAALGLLVLGGAGVALWFTVPPVVHQGQQFALDAPDLWDGLRARLQHLMSRHPDLRVEVPDWNELMDRLQPYAQPLVGRLGQYLLNAASVILSGLLMVVLVVYTLASPQPLVAGLLAVFPETYRPEAERILSLILARLKTWAVGSLILGLVMGVLAGVGVYLLGLPFALVFGLLAALGELIPNLGPVLAATPPILVALAADPIKALWVAILFIVLQQLENLLLVPIVWSRTLDLHPLSTAFMMLVMGALFGLPGVILAVPAVVVIKTVYEELYMARQVRDHEALMAQSERVVAEEATLLPEESDMQGSVPPPDEK
jgi:putative permease